RASVLHEVAGAKRFVELLQRTGWTVALATGAWSESAALKLGLAGFPVDLPLACCDTYASREDIVRHAIGSQQPSNIVIFGDGWWDVRTARNLSLPFVGVAADSAADALRRAGATEVIPDFSDAEVVLAAMQRARPPR
ncbi:MAG TPA: HAD family hydrolase, partial [Thermoanaerobaculia bacterium]